MDCQLQREPPVDLVDAFINIGLPDGADGRDNASDDSGGAARIGDYATPTMDHLRRYYLMSRGRDALVPEAD